MADDNDIENMDEEERNRLVGEAIKRGQEYLKQMKWEEAISAHTEAIELFDMNDIASADFYYERGNAYSQIRILGFAQGVAPLISDSRGTSLNIAAHFPDYARERAIADYNKVIILLGESNPKSAKSYFKRGQVHDVSGNFNDAISYYKKAIDVQGLDARNTAQTHICLATVYRKTSNWDEIIIHLTHAISVGAIENEFMINALQERASAFLRKSAWDDAIRDFKESLNRTDKTNDEAIAKINFNLASAHANKQDWRNVIASLNITINLSGEDNDLKASAHRFRGLAYLSEEELSQAVSDFDNALTLYLSNPQENGRLAQLYALRSLTFFKIGKSAKALSEYIKAVNEYEKVCKIYGNSIPDSVTNSLFSSWATHLQDLTDKKKAVKMFPHFVRYIEYAQNTFFNQLSQEQSIIARSLQLAIQCKKYKVSDQATLAKLFIRMIPLFESTDAILDSAFQDAQEFDKFSHYTSLTTLRSLLPTLKTHAGSSKENEGFFRLYDAVHMNDSNEGQSLFEKIGEELCSKFNLREQYSNPSLTCIGSFVIVDDTKPARDDSLTLWRFYGKNDGIEATGCNLVYSKSKFSSALQNKIFNAAAEGIYIEKSSNDQVQNLPQIFVVRYLPEKGRTRKEVSKEIRHLKKALDDIVFIKGGKAKEIQKSMVRDTINDIRFLYKSQQYKDEKEARIIMRPLMGKSKIDYKNGTIAPLYYTETNLEFIPDRITLAPNAPPGWEEFLKRYLRNEEIEVQKSKIKFKPN